jgi:hypothetical protein
MKGSVEIWDANGVLESVVHPTEDTGPVDRPSLAEIPFEVFTESILPYLGVKEVGALATMCQALKDLCDDNSLWKILYLRTIRAHILDTSVHIGSKALQKNLHHSRYGAIVESPLVIDPCVLYTRWYGNQLEDPEYNAEMYIKCLPCVPYSLLNTPVPVWREWSSPLNLAGYYHPMTRTPEDLEKIVGNRRAYEDKIRTVWQDHNRDQGFSTQNLCQNPSHYLFETLGMPTSCRNLKSYKKAVLKKLLTQEKQPLKSLAKKRAIQEKLVREAEKTLDALRTDDTSLRKEISRKHRAMESLSRATQ